MSAVTFESNTSHDIKSQDTPVSKRVCLRVSVNVLVEEDGTVVVTVCYGADVHFVLLHVGEGIHGNLRVIVEPG